MTQSLNNFLTSQSNTKYATQNGTEMHLLLKHIVIDNNAEIGDKNIIDKIKQYPEIMRFFTKNTKTEVAIAGVVNNIFISRRIDRLLIDSTNKIVEFIDYKTDTDKSLFIDKYKKQLHEYAQLLKSAYPEYKITGYILWVQDWNLEKIV